MITSTSVAAVIGWNAIPHATSAEEHFTDLPGTVFPFSYLS